MIFRFVVRRLRRLGRVPLLPQLFDAWLMAITALTAPRKLRAIQLLDDRLCRTFGASRRVHRFGGTGFYVGGVELGHVHGNGLCDVFIGRARRESAIATGAALPHHVFPNSGWVSFWIESESDVEAALQLLRLALDRQQDGVNGANRRALVFVGATHLVDDAESNTE